MQSLHLLHKRWNANYSFADRPETSRTKWLWRFVDWAASPFDHEARTWRRSGDFSSRRRESERVRSVNTGSWSRRKQNTLFNVGRSGQTNCAHRKKDVCGFFLSDGRSTFDRQLFSYWADAPSRLRSSFGPEIDRRSHVAGTSSLRHSAEWMARLQRACPNHQSIKPEEQRCAVVYCISLCQNPRAIFYLISRSDNVWSDGKLPVAAGCRAYERHEAIILYTCPIIYSICVYKCRQFQTARTKTHTRSSAVGTKNTRISFEISRFADLPIGCTCCAAIELSRESVRLTYSEHSSRTCCCVYK